MAHVLKRRIGSDGIEDNVRCALERLWELLDIADLGHYEATALLKSFFGDILKACLFGWREDELL
jgi:hypothetical protein